MKKLSWILVLMLLMSTVSFAPAAAEEATYEQTLFDQSKPIEIDIRMDDEAWNNMIATASEEECVPVSMCGEAITRTSISAGIWTMSSNS